MDKRHSELLSRYLDDDLNENERADFENTLEKDPELRSELDTARRLRLAVASVAAGMNPPAELDRVMEPLCQGAPAPGRRVRPLYGWLGAAAAVVLGVTVTLEMARRNPAPTFEPPTRSVDSASEDREIFELAPLPSAVPDDNRPIGATQRLLEEEPPPPAVPEPPALEVVGPLSTDEFTIATESAPPAPKKEKASSEVGGFTRDEASEELKSTLHKSDQDASLGSGRREKNNETPADDDPRIKQSATAAGVAGRLQSDSEDRFRQEISTPIAVLVDGIEVWTGSSSDCAPGRWPVVLVFQNGIVVDIRTDDGAVGGDSVESCRPDGLINGAIRGLPDGEVIAEIVVSASE